MPTRILFGAGKLNELAKSRYLPGNKALIVISAGTSMKKYGYLDMVIGYLQGNSVQSVVFDKILANPVVEHVTEGAALAKQEGCDFVIGLGGGSSIDSAKSIAVMAKKPRRILGLCFGWQWQRDKTYGRCTADCGNSHYGWYWNRIRPLDGHNKN